MLQDIHMARFIDFIYFEKLSSGGGGQKDLSFRTDVTNGLLSSNLY